MDLRNKYLALASRYAAGREKVSDFWQEIETYYSASGRYYHTLSHIGNLLGLHEEYKSLLRRPDLVEFAIWYHDIIYDPKRGDNESLSAELAEKRMRELGVPENDIRIVKQLIEATKTHSLLSETETFDGRFFLDADLSILGAEPEVYREYAENIRREFSHVPPPVYSMGRAGVLKTFLNRERIFKTDELYARFEKQARENIGRELKLLGT